MAESDLTNSPNKEDPRSVGLNTARIVDSETFIRHAFETDHLKGCELLFKRYYQPLCSHVVRYVYSRTVAEDIVMEVFSRFWQNKIYRQVNTSYRAYLFTTVRHAAFAYLKSEFGKDNQEDSARWSESDELSHPSTPHQLLQYHELHDKIEQILKCISPQGQKVFIMSRFDGKKNQDIADELNLSVKTVEGHITRVISIIRRGLKESGYLTSIAAFVGASLLGGLLSVFVYCLPIFSQL